MISHVRWVSAEKNKFKFEIEGSSSFLEQVYFGIFSTRVTEAESQQLLCWSVWKKLYNVFAYCNRGIDLMAQKVPWSPVFWYPLQQTLLLYKRFEQKLSAVLLKLKWEFKFPKSN